MLAGYFISLSSLQAFLLCLDDLQLYSMPRLTSWAWNGVACVLTIGGVVAGALMANAGTQLYANQPVKQLNPSLYRS